jgi:hypothetical protein
MEYSWKKRRPKKVLKGLTAGVIGGIAGSWVMTKFQELWSESREALAGRNDQAKGDADANDEDATMKTADMIARSVAGRSLTKEQKQKAAPLVHYAFGAVMGGLYGAAAELEPDVKRLGGTTFGAALFLGADELTLPVLGLAKKPTEYPLSSHIYGLTSHIVYGLTTELVRRAVRERL